MTTKSSVSMLQVLLLPLASTPSGATNQKQSSEREHAPALRKFPVLLYLELETHLIVVPVAGIVPAFEDALACVRFVLGVGRVERIMLRVMFSLGFESGIAHVFPASRSQTYSRSSRDAPGRCRSSRSSLTPASLATASGDRHDVPHTPTKRQVISCEVLLLVDVPRQAPVSWRGPR